MPPMNGDMQLTELIRVDSTGRHYLVFKDQKVTRIYFSGALTNLRAADRVFQYIVLNGVVKDFLIFSWGLKPIAWICPFTAQKPGIFIWPSNVCQQKYEFIFRRAGDEIVFSRNAAP
jgi:hypothetical protein